MFDIINTVKALEGSSPYEVITTLGSEIMIPLILIVAIPSLAFILFGYLLGVQKRPNFWALWLVNTAVIALTVFIILPLLVYWLT